MVSLHMRKLARAALVTSLLLSVGAVPWHAPAGWNASAWTHNGEAAAPVNFLVHFRSSATNSSALDAALTAISKPRHPRYGRHLKPAEVFSMMNPTAATKETVKSWLLVPGVVIKKQYPQAFAVSATPQGIRNLLCGITLSSFTRIHDDWTISRVHPTNASRLPSCVPAQVASVITGLHGLTTFTKPSRQRSVRSNTTDSGPIAYNRVLRQLQSSFNPITTRETLLKLYNVPATAQGHPSITQMAAEFNGAGSSSDALGPTNVAASNWQAYNSANGLPQMAFSTQFGAIGSTTLAETYLDVEVLGAMGYGGLSSTQGNSNAFYNLDESADDASDCFAYFGQEMLQLAQTSGVGTPFGVPYVISMSWGQPESDMTADGIAAANSAFQQLTAMGVTLVASSGDSGANVQTQSGASDCSPGTLIPDWPATSPYVLAVGATAPAGSPAQLANPATPICQSPPSGYACLNPQPETACSAGSGNVITSGGGFSLFSPMPAWQRSAVNRYLTAHSAALPPSSVFNSGNRAYPDVSASGAFYLINCPYSADGQCQYGVNVVFGTSAAAPLWAGVIALVNAARMRAGFPVLGFVNPLLYEFAANYSDGTVLNDVTTGDNTCLESDSNGNVVCGCQGYAAAPGFDAVTGLGTPNVNGLILAAMSEAPPVVPPYAWVPTPANEPLSIGAIAGIVAACIVAIIIITGVFMCLRNRCCVSRAEGSVVDTSPGKHGYSY